MEKIKLNSIEEAAALKAANSLPKGIRAMLIGNKVIFVRFNGKWMPVPAHLQAELEKKHLINDTTRS